MKTWEEMASERSDSQGTAKNLDFILYDSFFTLKTSFDSHHKPER